MDQSMESEPLSDQSTHHFVNNNSQAISSEEDEDSDAPVFNRK